MPEDSPSIRNDSERLRKAALGLTLVNAGLGLALWALLIELAGLKWNFIAILSLGAAFLHVLGLAYCAQAPRETKGTVPAWIAAVVYGVFFFLVLHGLMLSETHRFDLRWLMVAAGGELAALIYLLLLIRYCEASSPGTNGAMMTWWAAVVVLTLAFTVELALLFLEVEEELRLPLHRICCALPIATFGIAAMRTRRLVLPASSPR